MSSGVKGAIMVSIPSSVKEMIDNIKDITGQNHTEDEIYAVLKECSMDPNETLQRLLLLDTFHEVKRKRYRRKEEPTELRWKPVTQARANKGSRGNYSSRYKSHDADGGKGSAAVKEIGTDHPPMKGMSKAPLGTAPEMKKNETISVTSPITDVSNGPSSITTQSTHEIRASSSGSVNQSGATENAGINKLEGSLRISSPIDSVRKASNPEIWDIHQQQKLSLKTSTLIASPSAAGSYNSSSDPVPFTFQDLPLPTAVGSITSEVGSPHTHEVITDNNEINSVSAGTSASGSGSSNMHQKITNELHVVGKNKHVEFLSIVSTTGVSSVNSRPSSNYNNRSQIISPHKVGAAKEWKPKSTSSFNTGQVSATTVVSEVSINYPESQPIPIAIGSKEATLELQKKLEDSHISDVQHVIIPNHLHVPETEKLWFRFGSFDVNFNLDKSQNGGPENDESQPLSESYEAINESMKELPLSSQNVVTVVKDSEIKYPDEPQSPSQGPESFSSSEGEVPSSIIPDYPKSNQEVGPGSLQHPAVHTSSNYNIGFIPPVLSRQVSPLESSDSQAHDVPRLPGIAQPMHPISYYGQFYRSTVDSDGRISPFNPALTANKYTSSASISVQTSQSPQEGGVPFNLSSSPSPLVTQAAGVMQSSVTATQQAFPVFRQTTGIHIPHYPPNYIPYGPYFSPIYVPPQAILQFLSNGAFPQQPQAGNIYPTPPGTAAKYSVSQYKQVSNTGSSTQIGMPDSFGLYDHLMANYTSCSSSAAVSSTDIEDLSASQIKENIYASGQQSEGSGVWFTNPSCDISNLQASSFYNLPQGQLAFTPTQPGPGTFTSIFHPAQAVTAATVHPLFQQSQSITAPAEIVGPTAHVYQQPQHTQLNWPTNY